MGDAVRLTGEDFFVTSTCSVLFPGVCTGLGGGTSYDPRCSGGLVKVPGRHPRGQFTGRSKSSGSHALTCPSPFVAISWPTLLATLGRSHIVVVSVVLRPPCVLSRHRCRTCLLRPCCPSCWPFPATTALFTHIRWSRCAGIVGACPALMANVNLRLLLGERTHFDRFPNDCCLYCGCLSARVYLSRVCIGFCSTVLGGSQVSRLPYLSLEGGLTRPGELSTHCLRSVLPAKSPAVFRKAHGKSSLLRSLLSSTVVANSTLEG